MSFRYRAIAISIGQSTFLNSLHKEAHKLVPEISVHDIITAGATKLSTLTSNDDMLRELRIVYARAVSSTLWLPVAVASAAALCACAMEWRRVTLDAEP